MAFSDRFPTYPGIPSTPGFYFNEEKLQIEDWTHTALNAEDPDPIHLNVEGMDDCKAEQAFNKWVQENRG